VGALRQALVPGWTAARQALPGVALAIALALVARGMADGLAHGAGACRDSR
jgi:hypothetical protein